MGGVTRRSLLASLMALSLLCGGLGVASASLEVVDQSGTPGTVTIYTKDEVDHALTAKGAATDVAKNTADIAANKDNINKLETNKLDKDVANSTFATKDALNDLTTTVNGKADKTYVDTELANKADKADVYSKTGADDKFATKDALNNKADKNYVDTAVAGAVTTAGTNVDAKLADYAKTADVDTKLAGKADKATTLAGYGITDAYTKSQVSAKLNDKADKTDLTQAQTAIDGLNAKTTKITYDAALGTSVDGVTFNAGTVTGVTSINGTIIGTKEGGKYISQDGSIWGNMKKVDTQVETNAKNITKNKDDITALDTKVGTVGVGTYLDSTKSVGENLGRLNAGLEKEVGDRTAAVDAEKAAREAEDTNLSNRIGTVTEDGTYIKKSATNNVSENLKVLDTQAKTNADAIAQETADRKAAIGELTVDGNYIKKDKNVSDNLVELDKQAKANADAITETNQRTHGITRDDTRNETRIEGRVTVDTNGNINAEGTITSNGLNAGSGEITTSGKVSAGDVSTGTLETTGDATIGGNLDVKGTLNTKDVTAETIHVSKSEDTVDYKSEGSIIGEGGNLSVSNKKTDKSTNITEESQLHVNEKGTVNWATSTENATGNVTEGRSEVTADHIKNSVKKTEGGTTFGYEENITETGKVGTATDKDGNRNELTQTATSTENTVTSKDGNKSTTKQEAGSISSTVYDKDGNVKASSEMKEDGSISNNATGDMTNTVGGKLTTTVTGQATENFNGGLNTKVTGAENHTVTGKQTNTVEGGQENIISGGQINNITGDQTTTITGNKKETVTENVTEDYQKNLTTTVGGNEIHDVKGTKTETVEGKVTENFKDGQEINVTGNQDIHVTGKQTNKIDGNQENTIGGDQTTNVTGDILNTAKNITNAATETLTDKVGTNTRVINSTSITDTVGTTTNRKIEDGKITDTAGDSTVTTKDGEGTTFAKTTSAVYSTGTGAPTDTNIAGNLITTGRVDANELGVSDTDGNNKADLLVKAGEGVKASASDGTTTGSLDVKADGITTSITNGTDHNTVSSTLAGGTIFTNSEAAAPVTGDSGAGTAVNTTIKGNTITTGKVTMDYAEVMKDLGVHGNAKVDQNLEVGGTSTLKGDVTMESNATVKKDLKVEGTTTTKTLKVTENATVGGTLDVTQKATFHDDVDIKKNLSVDGNATIAGDVTAKSYKVGDKTYISAAGINANDQKITNVADGSISEGSKDAVNGGQLYGVKRDLEHKVDKVGANAAAMANLRPMEFDPSSKWNIAAAIGNYGSETAAALGAFYRPNDDVMVNLSTAFGTGENMVGGGVSVRLGKRGNKLSREETNALKAQVDDLTARMDALLSVLNPNMSKDFPDVPENHWAYEAVSRLAGNDIVQGYPDGEFHGERTMTRYEMAEIIYNALSRGAEAEKELVEEFKPELQAMAASEKATAEKAEG